MLSNHDVEKILDTDKITYSVLGSKRCSEKNMDESCFAAEFCTLDDMKGNYVPDKASSLYLNGGDAVVLEEGNDDVCAICNVSQINHHSSYKNYRFPPGSILVSSFCVPLEKRGKGYGREMLHSLYERYKKPNVFVEICTKGCSSGMEDISRPMRKRVNRLENTYARMGFSKERTGDGRNLYKLLDPSLLFKN
jgi:GNAT superfamily N-acetyltransferase